MMNLGSLTRVGVLVFLLSVSSCGGDKVGETNNSEDRTNSDNRSSDKKPEFNLDNSLRMHYGYFPTDFHLTVSAHSSATMTIKKSITSVSFNSVTRWLNESKNHVSQQQWELLQGNKPTDPANLVIAMMGSKFLENYRAYYKYFPTSQLTTIADINSTNSSFIHSLFELFEEKFFLQKDIVITSKSDDSIHCQIVLAGLLLSSGSEEKFFLHRIFVQTFPQDKITWEEKDSDS